MPLRQSTTTQQLTFGLRGMIKLVCLVLLVVVKTAPYKDNDRIPDIEVQASFIDSTLINIHWCGTSQDDDDRVLALTSKGTVYRSEDKGRSWTKSSEVFHRKALAELEDQDQQKVGMVNNIVASPINRQTVLFTGTESISWISLDCGKSITALYNGGRQLREFQFHPTDSELILASAWIKCDTKLNVNCVYYKELMLSENSGLSWHSIAQYINQFAWGYNAQNALVPKDRILATIDTKAKGHQAITSWNDDADFFYSDDFLTSRKLSVHSGARFLLSENYLFVAKVASAFTKEISLMVADPNTADVYDFAVIDADENLKEHAYTVLDTTEGQVFLVVSHIKAQAPIGVIYISDSTGTRYTRSLGNVARHESGAEFHRVQGLEGIYLANVYSPEQATLYEQSVLESMETGFGSYTQSFKDEDLQKFKQTRITFDKGGIWTPLKAPEVDIDGNPIRCDPRVCGLHLHLHHLQFGPVYTQNNSIGLIIATGSIGKYLSHRADQVHTFMSRDGGLTWAQIAKGSHIYEISDHGGLIVMASDQQAVAQIQYSWNEGLSWNALTVADTPLYVQNIITEPSNRSTRFIVYGSTTIESNGVSVEQGVVVTLDLEDLHQRKCQGLDTAGEQESDYELWTPSGLVNPECLFGKKVTYVRRKRASACFNPEVVDRIESVEPCKCTAEDYECDIHFSRDLKTKECIPNNQTSVTLPPLECSGTYTVSSGYLKIARDLCEGGVEYPSLELPCPGQSSSILEYAIIGGILAGIYWLYVNQETVKAFIQSPSGDQSSRQKQQQSQKQFAPVDLEDNERGLGYREFDEDLIIKDDPQPDKEQLEELI